MASGNDSDRYHAEDSGYTKNAGDVWAPSGVSGSMTGVSVMSGLLGVISLVLALASARPFLCWLLAAIAIISGLRIFLPRVTTLDKILITIGVLTAVVAIVVVIVGS